jgi:hypothetical protein
MLERVSKPKTKSQDGNSELRLVQGRLTLFVGNKRQARSRKRCKRERGSASLKYSNSSLKYL